jgi:hypothetical protein
MNGYKKVMVTQASKKAVAAGDRQEVAAQLMNPAAWKEAVIRTVSAWEGVTVHQHRFGGVEFRLGRRELGHIHASFADIPFPKNVRDELIAAGRARPHHVLPDSGWVTTPMRTSAQVEGVIELLRLNYDRAASARVNGQRD